MPFIVNIVITLVIFGLLLFLVDKIPMDPNIRQILHVVVIVAIVIWLLTVLLGYSGDYMYPMPHHRY